MRAEDVKGWLLGTEREEKTCEEGAKGKTKRCKRCDDDLPEDALEKKGSYNLHDVCKACRHPICAKCGARRESPWRPPPKAKDPVPLCDKCEKKEGKKKAGGTKKRR